MKNFVVNVIIEREINMTIKAVNHEKKPKVKEKGWNASKIVGNLGPLSHKDLRYVLRVYKKLKWDFFF
ncbi:hypothetical protein CRD_00789 [Raphidiopsis brookii D9]|nr:hypothetical protein CRD_00789 [Raphidiopsis brookii D9]